MITMNSKTHNQLSGVDTFFAYLYILAQYSALFVIFYAIRAIFDQYGSLSEAIGGIFVFIIYIMFWAMLQLLSLVFLLLGKIWKQITGILVLSIIAVLANLSLVLIPILTSPPSTIVETLKSMMILIIPFLLHIVVIIKGFSNNKK